jgi:hypothetical protein
MQACTFYLALRYQYAARHAHCTKFLAFNEPPDRVLANTQSLRGIQYAYQLCSHLLPPAFNFFLNQALECARVIA